MYNTRDRWFVPRLRGGYLNHIERGLTDADGRFRRGRVVTAKRERKRKLDGFPFVRFPYYHRRRCCYYYYLLCTTTWPRRERERERTYRENDDRNLLVFYNIIIYTDLRRA